jgi:hypothetical protein
MMFTGLKGRNSPAQGESLGIERMRMMIAGLKGRRVGAQGESLGIDERGYHRLWTKRCFFSLRAH